MASLGMSVGWQYIECHKSHTQKNWTWLKINNIFILKRNHQLLIVNFEITKREVTQTTSTTCAVSSILEINFIA